MVPTTELFWNQLGDFNQSFLWLHIVWVAVSAVLLGAYMFPRHRTILNTFFKDVFMPDLRFQWHFLFFH
jgi:hypothetical protein